MRTAKTVLALVALALVGMISLAGCGPTATPDGRSSSVGIRQDSAWLEGSSWAATGIRDSSGVLVPIRPGSRVTATLEAGTVLGDASVNGYRGTYTTSGDDGIAFDVAATTKMAGPEPLMKQEAAFLAAMSETRTYRFSAERLELFDETGQPTVVFTASKPASLVGPTWRCTGFTGAGGATISPSAESTITLLFSANGRIAGSAGVNDYGAAYSSTGFAIKIGPDIATTRMAGPARLMKQETAYLRVLPTATRYTIDDQRLTLMSGDARVATYELTAAP